MKKYYVSKYRLAFMVSLMVITIVCALILILLGITALINEGVMVGGLFLIFLSIVGAGGVVKEFSSTAISTYSFSNDGIVYISPFKKKVFYWDKMKCCGSILSSFDLKGEYCLYIYFAENEITDDDILKLSSSKIRKRMDIFCFLYNEEAFRELMRYIPLQWQEKLKQDCEARVKQMGPITRLRYRMYK